MIRFALLLPTPGAAAADFIDPAARRDPPAQVVPVHLPWPEGVDDRVGGYFVGTQLKEGTGMPQAWNDKRERQYQHIKKETEQHGSSEKRAEEIAARTVNKDRAQSGESREASTTSTQDVSPEHRGGKRSGNRQGPGGETKDQLYEDARRAGVPGRSTMSKDELKDALDDE